MRQILYSLTAMMALVFMFSSCKKDDDDEQQVVLQTDTVKVGALLSLTGNWSSLGITSKAATEIALEDINAYMIRTGSRYRFASIVYDTKLEGTLATKFIAEARGAGCRFVLGPQSSAEAAAIKDYLNEQGMFAVSQGSTAGSLSIENDNLFRFCPDDQIEGLAMARTIYKDGVRALVTAARNDAGNKGLQLSTANAFKALGGVEASTGPYSDAAGADLSATLAEIKAHVQQLMQSRPASQVAVYLASFDECVAMFQQAAGDPVLSGVRWYGGDGTALSTAITSNVPASDFAIATKYFAPAFGLPAQASAKWQPLVDKITTRTGVTPDAFALAAYDALWVIAMTYNAFPYDKVQYEQLKSEFPVQAGRYYGATGATMLNRAGDRAVGSYDYWGIVKEGSGYKWVMVGKSE
jgi:branched-chain amino acid transport system substrate-binding protein